MRLTAAGFLGCISSREQRLPLSLNLPHSRCWQQESCRFCSGCEDGFRGPVSEQRVERTELLTKKFFSGERQGVALGSLSRPLFEQKSAVFSALRENPCGSAIASPTPRDSSLRSSLTRSSIWRVSAGNELTDSFRRAFCYCKLLINNGHWRFTFELKLAPDDCPRSRIVRFQFSAFHGLDAVRFTTLR